MGRAGTEVGLEAALLGRGEGQAAQVRQAAGAPAVQRSVEKARHIQFGGQPVGERVAQLEGGREVVWWPFARHVGDEGHHVERTEPGVDALVAAQVDQVDRGAGQRAGGLGHDVGPAGQGEDRTVVVGVTVEVDQGGGGGLGEPAEHRVVPAFGDIGHALHEVDRHRSSVTPAPRCGTPRASGSPRSPEARGIADQDRGTMVLIGSEPAGARRGFERTPARAEEGPEKRRSVRGGGHRVGKAAAAQDAAALTLGGSTPDAVVDVVLEGVLEAGLRLPGTPRRSAVPPERPSRRSGRRRPVELLCTCPLTSNRYSSPDSLSVHILRPSPAFLVRKIVRIHQGTTLRPGTIRKSVQGYAGARCRRARGLVTRSQRAPPLCPDRPSGP